MSSENLEVAINSVKAGDKSTAKQLLASIVKVEPQNETAWMWLSVCLEVPDQKRFCLNRVLAINPNNEHARLALSHLESLLQPSLSEIIATDAIAPHYPQPSTNLAPRQATDTGTHTPLGMGGLPSSASEPSPPADAFKAHGLLRPLPDSARVGKYVQSILLPDEAILAVAKLHWGIFVAPAVGLLLVLLFSTPYVITILVVPPGARGGMLEISLICLLPLWTAAFIWLLRAFIVYTNTEFALTHKRIIGKSGFIATQSLELVLSKVESIQIKQGLLGRLLNFGSIVVSGSGGTDQPFPNIANPKGLKQKINAVLAEK